MQDIAADLKLSRATVCYALGEHWQAKGIAPLTRKLVLRRSRELGYRRNRIAAGLTTRSTRTIGLLIPCVADMYADMLAGVEEAVEGDYALLLGISEYEPQRERQLLESFEDRMVDGLIIVNAARQENAEYLNRLSQNGLPIVQADRHFDGVRADIVETDGFQLIQVLTQYMLSLGHRDIAYVPSPTGSSNTNSRRQGYEATMAEKGLPARILKLPMPDPRQWKSPYYKEGFAQVLKKCDPLPTAIVVHEDGMLADCIWAMEERGICCPDDISIAGAGREDAGEWNNPLLRFQPTRVVCAIKEMGRRAAAMLLQRMRSRSEDWPEPRRETILGRLLTGGTTAPPRPENSGGGTSRLSKCLRRGSQSTFSEVLQ